MPAYQGVRKRSAAEFAGLPIYDIALGPDLEKGEGYYACGGAAAGKHSLSALAQAPAAVEFFRSWLPWFGR